MANNASQQSACSFWPWLTQQTQLKSIRVKTVNCPRGVVDDFLLVDADPRNLKFKLKPVKNDAAAYKALFGPEDEFIESSNVTANYRYFRQRLTFTSLTAAQLWDAICRLEVMHLDLEPHDDPQRIFESLNSTGLNLSESDKIRNFVLMKSAAERAGTPV